MRTGRTHGVDTRLIVAFLVLVGLLGAYAFVHRAGEPRSPFVGRARVIDGDTVDISGARIRLEGIDALESNQSCTDSKGQAWPCGRTATDELRAHVGGRELTCRSSGLDRYHRHLAVCSLPDGSDVNAWMVRQGWAVATGFLKTYGTEEAEAEAAKRGIWAGRFMPPVQWRRLQPH